jgi:hypothetical protein
MMIQLNHSTNQLITKGILSKKDMKKELNFLGIDESKVKINPNIPKINLETPEIKSHLSKVSNLLKNVKIPF